MQDRELIDPTGLAGRQSGALGTCLLGDGVQASVINTEAMTTIFLANHDNWARPGAVGWPNDMCFLHSP